MGKQERLNRELNKASFRRLRKARLSRDDLENRALIRSVLWLATAAAATVGLAMLTTGCQKTAPIRPDLPDPTPTVSVTPAPTPTVTPTPSPTPTASAVPTPTPTASAVPTPTPTPTPSALVYFGPNAHSSLKPGGVDYDYGQRTLALMNQAVASGCVLEKALAWDFESLHGVINPALKKFQKLEAMQRYYAGAPYPLDATWYYTWRGVVGYTYNFLDGWDSGESETRVWTNTKYNLAAEDYAAHLSHELSHQARAGGFVHYTFHQGSFPYEIGDIMFECIQDQQVKLAVASFMGVTGLTKKSTKSKVTARNRIPILDTEGCYR